MERIDKIRIDMTKLIQRKIEQIDVLKKEKLKCATLSEEKSYIMQIEKLQGELQGVRECFELSNKYISK